nr:MAG TPA: hypothetical protein [Caudoviricetes sp.]
MGYLYTLFVRLLFSNIYSLNLQQTAYLRQTDI